MGASASREWSRRQRPSCSEEPPASFVKEDVSATLTRPIRFLHLADLHLLPCPRVTTCKLDDRACDVCIKKNILEGLTAWVTDAKTRPDLILLAGDLTELRDGHARVESWAAPLDEFVRTARKAGTVVAGITGEHDGKDGTARLRSDFGWDWLLRTGEVNRDAGIAIHGIEGRPHNRGSDEDLLTLTPREQEISIVLAHGEQSLSSKERKHPRFSYYALGHRHASRVWRVNDRSLALAAYPGHLFSYWDGDGKAWPTNVVVGTISQDGVANAELVRLSGIAGAPETRRLWVDFRSRESEAGSIVLENAPSESLFADAAIEVTVDVPEPQHSGRRAARIPYGSRAQMREILSRIVGRMPDDVFISPSTGEGWRTRFAYRGKAIGPRRLDELVTKVFKRSERAR